MANTKGTGNKRNRPTLALAGAPRAAAPLRQTAAREAGLLTAGWTSGGLRAMRTVAIVLTLVAALGSAHADAPEAKKHYDRGMRAYNLQDFRGALTEFQRAYVEMPDPAFLFNIGQAQRQLGEYEAASKSFHLFLANAPDAPNRDQVARLIEQVDKDAAEARAKTSTPASPPAATPVTPPTTVTTAARSSPPPRKWYASPLGWSLVGVGVAAVGVSGGLLGVAISERSSALNATTQADFDAHHNRSIMFQQAGWPLLGVGAALVVGGTIVLALRSRSAHR